MPVVDRFDVEALLGRDLTVGEAARADRLLEMAQAQLENALPGFSMVTGTETVSIWPRGDRDIGTDGTIWTPRFPVTAITSIKIFDLTIPYNSTVGLYGYRWAENGQIVFAPWEDWMPIVNTPWLARGYVPYDVTYSFGLDPLPADLAGAIAAPIAAIIRQQKANPDGLTSERLGSYNVRYKELHDVDPVEVGPITQAAVAVALRRWRRTRQVSVPMARHL